MTIDDILESPSLSKFLHACDYWGMVPVYPSWLGWILKNGSGFIYHLVVLNSNNSMKIPNERYVRRFLKSVFSCGV